MTFGPRPCLAALAAALSLVLLSSIAAAQTGLAEDEPIEEIFVTGSIIKRTEDSSQLVTNISRDEIELRGATTAVDILAAVVQNHSSVQSTGTGGSGLVDLASLRSLGPENTLVLFNGKRMVKNPLWNNGVDLNVIPVALLESVDVLADGASSVYGSDAVAGVINFRTRRDLGGLHFYGNLLEPEAGDGQNYAAAISGGFGSLADDGWNVSAGATFRERKPIQSKDRSYAASSDRREDRGLDFILRQGFPANVSQFDAVTGDTIIENANPYPECDPPGSIPYRGACGIDADAAGQIELQNPEQQTSLYGQFTGHIGEHTASIEYLYADSELSAGIAPTTFSSLIVPTSSPYFPGAGIVPAIPGLDPNQEIRVTSRWEPGGRRNTGNETDTDRVLATLEGVVGGFDYELWAMRSSVTAQLVTIDGAYLNDEFVAGFQGVNGVYLNPFGDQSPEAQAYLESIRIAGPQITAEGDLTMAGMTFGRDVFELPAGPVSAALAFEYGDEGVSYERGPVADLGIGVVVGGNATTSGGRERFSATAEVLVPLSDRIEANLSLRHDDYSDFGGTTNPKILVNWEVTDTVNLHASYNTGFRAPTLYNLYSPTSLGFIFAVLYDDPVLCPGGVVDTAAGGLDIRDCAQLYNNTTGGNTDLGPEESTAYTAGITLRPTDTLSFSIDFWDYELDKRIEPLAHTAIFANPDRFSDFLVRCSEADPAFAAESRTCTFGGGGDPIAYVVQTDANLGKTRTSGIDLSGNWSRQTDLGTWDVGYRATWTDEYEFQRVPGEEFFSRAGVFFDGYPVFEYSHYLAAGWQRDRLSAQLQNRYMSDYEDCNDQCGIDPAFHNTVDAYSVWNVAGSYRFTESLAATLHINNILDEDPPFTNNAATLCTGCDTRWVDVTGRAYGLTVRADFF